MNFGIQHIFTAPNLPKQSHTKRVNKKILLIIKISIKGHVDNFPQPSSAKLRSVSPLVSAKFQFGDARECRYLPSMLPGKKCALVDEP